MACRSISKYLEFCWYIYYSFERKLDVEFTYADANRKVVVLIPEKTYQSLSIGKSTMSGMKNDGLIVEVKPKNNCRPRGAQRWKFTPYAKEKIKSIDEDGELRSLLKKSSTSP